MSTRAVGLSQLLAICGGVLVCAATLCAQKADQPAETVSESGPHHRVWEWSEVDEQGQTNVHAYTELATGLNVWNAETGRWEESDPAFDLTAEGQAVSRRTQHRLTLAPQVNAANGAVDFLAADGQRFRSTVLGLTLFNRLTGRSLALAELKSDPPAGELVASNAVLYPDCFDNLRADVRVENRLDGFHHDVILRESLDGAALTAAGFPPDVSLLETWTEWFEAPEPKVEARVVKSTSDPALRARMVEPDIIDESLDFGASQFAAGVAYLASEAGPGTSIPVTKRWLKRNDRSYLVESCELSALRPMLAALPKRRTAQDDEQLIAGRRPPSPSLIEHSTNSVLVASADTLKRMRTDPGLVWDYNTISTGQSAYTFKSDNTYLITAPVNFSGANYLEGGAVIKFSPASYARIAIVSGATLTCLTSPFGPAVFTARDDHSVGEKIGLAALNGYYATTALYFAGAASDLKHLRIAYAEQAVVYNSSGTHTIQHSQLINCQWGLVPNSSTLAVRNVLMNNVTTAFGTSAGSVTFAVTAEHVTVNGSTYLANAGAGGATLNAVNCLLANVSNLQPNGNTALSGNNNGFYLAFGFGSSQISVPANPFVTVKAGAHYLVAGSNLRNAGSTGINSMLANQLKSLTTWPPIERTAHFSAPTTLGVVAPGDTDIPDVGYHYDRLDHIFTALDLTSTLVLTNGAAIGVYGAKGIVLKAGAKLISEGTPTNLNRLVRYHAVQEQANTTWTPSTGSLSLLDLPVQVWPLPEIRLRFTDLSMLAGITTRRQFYNNSTGTSLGVLSLEHCQWRGLYLDGRCYSIYGMTVSLTNNLIQRGTLSFFQQTSTGYQNYTLTCYNNLFLRGTHTFAFNSTGTTWTVKDNLFDCDGLSGGTYAFTAGNNGYKSGLTSLGGINNKTGLTPDYQTNPVQTFFYGPLGTFYYPTTGGQLSQLINTGSRTAGSAGLYHFTVKTAANTKEGTDSPQDVDIGYHYVGVNANSLPLDYDGDTVADYVEDRNGDGIPQAWETFNWQLADTDSDGLADLQEYELTFNILVNDLVNDYTNEQNTQFESTVTVLNGNVIVAYVDANNGVYDLGQDSRLSSLTPRFVGYSVSRDNGVTFAETVLPPDIGTPPLNTHTLPDNTDDGDAGDPVLAVDKASGIVYMAGTSPRSNPGWKGIPFWKSVDGGVTFGTPINIHIEKATTDKPWITVDNANGTGQHDVYLTFTTGGVVQRLWLTVSTDNGATWPTLQQIQVDGTSHQAQSAIPVVSATHVAYVFWWEQQPTSDGVNYPGYLKVRAVQGRGTNLGTIHPVGPQLVTTDGTYGNLNPLRSSSAASDDTFRAFPFPVPAVNPTLSKANHLYVAYADKVQGSNDKADVFFLRSINGGANWDNGTTGVTTPKRVNNDPGLNDQWMPVICVKPDGTKLFIGWYDRRNDANNSLIDVYGRWGTIATDGTVTFGTEFKITTASFPPVFAGTRWLTDPVWNDPGYYDPVYPPQGVNLHWHYDELHGNWPDDPSEVTGFAFRDHVGEYDGAWAEGPYVYMSWTDNRLTAMGTLYARQQRDIRLVRITWP